jgi:hypothetical protein
MEDEERKIQVEGKGEGEGKIWRRKLRWRRKGGKEKQEKTI